MQVGNLVRLKNIPEVIYTHRVDNVNAESIGLIVEWNPVPRSGFDNGGDGFVFWNGHQDTCVEYEEDLEVISETR